MEPCKICGKEYMLVNSAHVKTHDGMTIEEYREYVPPKTNFEKIKFKPYPDYLKLDAEIKTNMQFLKAYIKPLIPSEFVTSYYGLITNNGDTAEEFICSHCGEAINDIQIYFILKDRIEIIRNQVMAEQKGMHRDCALFNAKGYHRVAFTVIMNVLKISIN